jgi:C-1 hydroxylase
MTDFQAMLERRTDAWNRRDPVALAAAYADDAVVTSPMFPHAEGRAAIQASFTALFHVFPDWTMTFEATCVNGNRAIQPCRIRATQKGDFMGLPATGRRIEFDCVLIYDMEGGLIKRERRVYDFTAMLLQLGILRAKPAV